MDAGVRRHARHNPASQWTSHHLTAVNLYVVGERNDVPGYRRIVREDREAVSEWPSFAEESEIDEETIKSIETDMERFAPRERLVGPLTALMSARAGWPTRPAP